jgi:hypothetical protein
MAFSQAHRDGVAVRRLNGGTAFAFGAVSVLAGLAGFVVSGGHHAVGRDGGLLLGVFQVNMAHNVVHIVVGAVLIAAGIVGTRAARRANLAVGVAYLGLFAVGLFIMATPANIIALNGADNVLHLVLGAALTAVAVRFDRDVV